MANDGITYQYHSHSEEDTIRLAEFLADASFPGMVIALDGDLGAGKTKFSQAFAKSLGVTAVVSSPTFTLIKEYQGDHYPLYHMDVYRIHLDEADELGLDDYFYGAGISLVEWASRIVELLPDEYLAISIENLGEHERMFNLVPWGRTFMERCKNLKENGVIS